MKRNLGLDIIRSIAIILVMLSHSGFPDYFGIKFGELGVEVFFVLSGFLIGQILIKEFTAAFTFKTLLNFWIRRWFRTLPLYYLLLVFSFIFIDHSLGIKSIVYLFFLQNNFVGISLMPVSWSLVIEEWFYLSLPVLLFIFFRKGIKPKNFVLFLCSIILVELLARYVWVVQTNRSWEAIVGNFPFRLDSLAIGVLIASFKRQFQGVYIFLSKPAVFFISLAGVILLLLLMGKANQTETVNLLIWTRTLSFSLLSIFIAGTIPFIETNQSINKLSAKNILNIFFTWISILSYAMYLIHMLTYNFVYNAAIFSAFGIYKVCIANILVVVFAWILYTYYEKPTTNLRDKIKWKHNE